jgi:hypothetical protein
MKHHVCLDTEEAIKERKDFRSERTESVISEGRNVLQEKKKFPSVKIGREAVLPDRAVEINTKTREKNAEVRRLKLQKQQFGCKKHVADPEP